MGDKCLENDVGLEFLSMLVIFGEVFVRSDSRAVGAMGSDMVLTSTADSTSSQWLFFSKDCPVEVGVSLPVLTVSLSLKVNSLDVGVRQIASPPLEPIQTVSEG